MKNIDNLYLDLVHEKLRLIEEGHNKVLVEDALWDAAKGILGSAGVGFTQTLKGQIFEYLVNSLGIPVDSYIAQALKNMFANVEFKDYYRLITDCSFFTKQFTKSLIEAFIDMWRKSAGFDSFIHNMIKETLVEAASKSELYVKLEKNLAGFICPILKNLTSKIDMTVIKSMAR